ncbi:MAG TPA: iron-containing alcohol dehydrogenase [Bacteroidales bacterium]|nr:iron-containing alcohol dehydrogenase [Bacteroidales bacterium]HPO65951.1 iron-containing alcohol dehydrogenase [Bacteroidales bacterium]
MLNFEFQNPTRIVFGKDQVSQLSRLLPRDAKILFTYGQGSIKRNGVYDAVLGALKGFTYVEFGGIEPNPSYETLMKAVEIVKKEGISFLLAVGGGSVIDGTKFIAAAPFVAGDPWDILTGKAEVTKALPLGTVLTLPATGTEMNGNAVISRYSTKEKLAFSSPLVKPVFSILDPQYCFTLPDTQISNGVVDAFVHVMEQYLTYPVGAGVQDGFSESLLRTLMEVGPKVLHNKTNYTYAATFMWATTMALNGLISAGVPEDWSTHAIGHELTALHGIDHAKTLAIVLPGVMHVMRENKKDKLIQYGHRVLGIQNPSADNIDQIIAMTEAFFHAMQIKTRLSDYGVGKDTVQIIVDRFRQRNQLLGERADMGPEVIEKVLLSRL